MRAESNEDEHHEYVREDSALAFAGRFVCVCVRSKNLSNGAALRIELCGKFLFFLA